MVDGIIFDLDPIIWQWGPLQLRYYGIIFVIMLYLGYFLWRWQILRGGYKIEIAQNFLIIGVLAVLVGARLGHCFFYETEFYLTHPIEIFKTWNGGLSSHGATIGLVLALVLYARHYKINALEVTDRFSFAAATGAALVRLGNFINSEIVGRATDLPWAVRFVRHDNGVVARHPSQIYEFLLGILVFVVLLIADRRFGKEQRPMGLLTGLFLTVYFAGRFVVEFFKEYQTLDSSALTMGQYLSIIPFLAGLLLLWQVKKQNRAKRVKAAKKNKK